MPLAPEHETTKTATPSRRRRQVLLGSVFALALTGALVGENLVAHVQPAFAQTTTSQPQPAQAQMMSFADMVEKVKPAVVSVRVKTEERQTSQALEDQIPFFRDLPQDHPLRRFFGEGFGIRPDGRGDQQARPGQRPQQQQPRRFGMSQGSGFFISADGYVVTNNHVVEKATEVELVDEENRTYKAKVVGTDPRTDLALLKVDGVTDHKFVSFAKTMPRVGDWVVAIGNPFGLGGSVTAGIVSARGRDIGAGPYDDFLQIDAPVNRGNSGGPTFNLNGEVVGINTAIYSPSGGSVGIAFAVPSEVATGVIADLRTSGAVTRGWLGVQIQPVNDDIASAIGMKEAKGALVVDAQSGTPAEKAGIKSGDAIVAVNGQSVADPRELSRRIASLKPGSKVDLTVLRDGRERTLTVELGKLPEQQQMARADRNAPSQAEPSRPTTLKDLGLELQSARRVDGAGDQGVAVTGVEDTGAAANKLRTGDVILEVAGRQVSTPADVQDAVKAARDKGSRSVLMRVKSGDNTRFVALPVDRG